MDLEHKLKNALKSNDKLKVNSIFEEIYHNYGKLIFFCISKYISDRMDVEELTNDVFLNFFNNLDRIIELKSIKYYLMTSAKNTAINFLKKRKLKTVTKNEPMIDIEDDESLSDDSIYQQVIKQMKEILNEKEIEIIISHQLHGIQLKDIAKEMDASTNTIKSTYRRAIKKFQQKYKEV